MYWFDDFRLSGRGKLLSLLICKSYDICRVALTLTRQGTIPKWRYSGSFLLRSQRAALDNKSEITSKRSCAGGEHFPYFFVKDKVCFSVQRRYVAVDENKVFSAEILRHGGGGINRERRARDDERFRPRDG